MNQFIQKMKMFVYKMVQRNIIMKLDNFLLYQIEHKKISQEYFIKYKYIHDLKYFHYNLSFFQFL